MSHGRSSWGPRRWSDSASDAPPELRAALQDARASATDSAAIARLAQRLGIEPTVGLTLAMSSSAPPGAAVAYKLWAYLSGAVAISGLALVLWAELRTPDGAMPTPLTSPALAAAPLTHPTTLAPGAGAEAGQRTPEPVASAIDPGAAAATVAVAETSSARATRSEASARRRPVATADPGLRARASGGKLDPDAELAILNRAQDALAPSPPKALALADEHARAYPAGVFAQEREVIAIEALLKLQRSDEAAARGRVFLSTFPGSTHAPRVQQLLALSR